MAKFDKKIRELSRNMKIPQGYSQKVDNVLRLLPDIEETQYKKKHWISKKKLGFAFCLACFILLLKINSIEASDNIFENFRLTIMSILNIKGEDSGVKSNQTQIESRKDLLMELRETVIDSHNIYLLVKITAPSDIEFNKDIAFDYFAFCYGENYNANELIEGAKDCYMLEVMEEKPNVATYVVMLSSNRQLSEGECATVYFKDLKENPFSDNPKMLVEGMWSINFTLDMTVRDNIIIEGTDDMIFPFVNGFALLNHIELTPLGLTVCCDVSDFSYEELAVSDTVTAVRLIMNDGSEEMVMSHNPYEELIVDVGSTECSQEGGKLYKTDVYSFKSALDINRVVGIYIENLFIPCN